MNNLRTLLWIYLWLLIFEGALRKWIIPALDAPLLIIRDPLVIWIYFVALQQGYSFRNSFFFTNLFLAVTTGLLALFAGHGTIAVTLYGLRTNYLQIPLLFLIPQILDRDDVIKIGRFLLLTAIPIALLVLLQFRSPVDAWVNKGAFRTHYGTVRPSGPFSFIPGLVSFFATVASFLFYGYLQPRTYKPWLIGLVTFMVLLGSAVSGSRSCLVSVGIVAFVAVICVVMRGKGGMGLLIAAVVIAIVVPILSVLPIFQDGENQLMRRFKDAGSVEGNTGGFVGRYADTMLGPLQALANSETFGVGIGMGTNAGLAMMAGGRNFQFVSGSENEWGRIAYESGPIFGFLIILFRCALTVYVGKCAYDAFMRGNLLPILIFASCGLLLLNGQWGVPTTLGFAILGGGLTLAADVYPEEEEEEEDYDEQEDDHVEGESDHPKADAIS